MDLPTVPIRPVPYTWFCLALILFATGAPAQAPKTDSVKSPAKQTATPLEASSSARSIPAANAQTTTLREGTELVEQTGQFRITGERVTFFMSTGTGRLIVLENLNLQRIVRILSENRASLDWKVSGLVTEYRGCNYLYVRAAVLKAGTEVRENLAP